MKNDGLNFMCLIYFSRCGAVFEHPFPYCVFEHPFPYCVFEHPFPYCGGQHSAALPDLKQKIAATHRVTSEYTKPFPSHHFMSDNYNDVLQIQIIHCLYGQFIGIRNK